MDIMGHCCGRGQSVLACEWVKWLRRPDLGIGSQGHRVVGCEGNRELSAFVLTSATSIKYTIKPQEWVVDDMLARMI